MQVCDELFVTYGHCEMSGASYMIYFTGIVFIIQVYFSGVEVFLSGVMSSIRRSV